MKTPTEEEVIAALGGDLKRWARQCHAASIHLVQQGIGTRVARGWATKVLSQHSWVVVGDDCYNPELIIDPTYWSYAHPTLPEVYFSTMEDGIHKPHGWGTVYDVPKPEKATGKPIKLSGLSKIAKAWLAHVEPLDRTGWAQLANGPMQGWPSKEIIAAMAKRPELKVLIPIDILGMLTNLNPGKLYLP